MPAFGSIVITPSFVFLRRFLYTAPLGPGVHNISADAKNLKLKAIAGGGRGGIVPGTSTPGNVEIGGGGAAGAYVEQWATPSDFAAGVINFEIGGYATGGGGAGGSSRFKNAAGVWFVWADGGFAGVDSPGPGGFQYTNGGVGSGNSSKGDWIIDGAPGFAGIAQTGWSPAIGWGGRNPYGSVAYGRGGDGYYQIDGAAVVPGTAGSQGAIIIEEYT